MRAPTYDETTIWLIEGLADYVRDELGHDAPWTQAHYEPGKATAGYQTTAHFLQYLERTHPGTVKRLAQALMDDTYSPDVFRQCTGKPLRRVRQPIRGTKQPAPDSKEGRGSPRGASLSPRGAPPALHAHAQAGMVLSSRYSSDPEAGPPSMASACSRVSPTSAGSPVPLSTASRISR